MKRVRSTGDVTGLATGQLETVGLTATLTMRCSVPYFVQCKSCQQEIVIDRDAPGADTVTITGYFTTFPNCPHCGAEHQYAPSDVQTRVEES